MTEQWRPVTTPEQQPGGVAVIDYTGESPELARELAVALDADTDPADAERLVLVAPPADSVEIAAAAIAFARHAGRQRPPEPGPACRRVWLVTRGGERVQGDPPARPGAAALAALHRSTGFGYPDQTFAHLDLPLEPYAAYIGAAVGALSLRSEEHTSE